MEVVITDISAADWTEADNSNTSAPPDGWPAGMPANAVEGAARALRGAVKRWYSHANATLTSGGSANAHTLTYGTAPSDYVSGDGYVFKAGFTNSGATTLNVNALGAKAIQFHSTALAGDEIVSGRVVIVYYDGVNFQLVNSQAPVTVTNLAAPLPIAQGGTGQSTAADAFGALGGTISPTAWTPTDGSGAGLSFTVVEAHYLLMGRLAVVAATIKWPFTGDVTAAKVAGLPVTAYAGFEALGGGATSSVSNVPTPQPAFIAVLPNTATFTLQGAAGGTLTNANLSGATIRFTIIYITT